MWFFLLPVLASSIEIFAYPNATIPITILLMSLVQLSLVQLSLVQSKHIKVHRP